MAGLLAVYSPRTCLTFTIIYPPGPKEGPIPGRPTVQLSQGEPGRELVKIPSFSPIPVLTRLLSYLSLQIQSNECQGGPPGHTDIPVLTRAPQALPGSSRLVMAAHTLWGKMDTDVRTSHGAGPSVLGEQDGAGGSAGNPRGVARAGADSRRRAGEHLAVWGPGEGQPPKAPAVTPALHGSPELREGLQPEE